MPRYAETALAPDVEQAISVLGANAARIAVLAFLREHPGSTTGQVARSTGLRVETVKSHLYHLLDVGVIEADPPRSVPLEERTGQRVRYTLNEERLNQELKTLRRSLGFVD